jgi:hypothetical protein
MSKEAMKLALEVMGLIGADLVCEAAHHEKADRHGIVEPCPIQARWHHAFATLREALAEQPAQQEPNWGVWPWPEKPAQQEPVVRDDADIYGFWARNKEAEQPAKQAAAIKTLEFLGYTYHGGEQWKPPLGKKPEWLDEPAPAQQEPVLQDIEQYRLQMAGISTAAIGYWKESDGIHPDYDTIALRDVAKLYAKYDELYRAQRTWVGLTDEEITDMWAESSPYYHEDDFARAIEAKLKEKNT